METNITTNDQRLSLKAVSEIMAVNYWHVRELVTTGQLRAYRTSNGAKASYRIRMSDLLAFEDANSNKLIDEDTSPFGHPTPTDDHPTVGTEVIQ